METGSEIFSERESIDSRLFALRHAILHELRLMREEATPGTHREKAIAEAARLLVIERDATARTFTISLGGDVLVSPPFDAFVFHAKTGAPATTPTSDAGFAHDGNLEKNQQAAREIATTLVNQSLADRASTPRTFAFNGISAIAVIEPGVSNIEETLLGIQLTLSREIAEREIAGAFEIVIVDDSGDPAVKETIARASAPLLRSHVITFPHNRGLASAFASGVARAQYDLIAYIEVGPRYDLSQLRTMLGKAERSEVVIGYRRDSFAPLLRKVAVKSWNLLTTILFGKLANDIDCGLKVFRRAALDDVHPSLMRSWGTTLNTELLARLRRAGKSITEVEIDATTTSGLRGSNLNPLTIAHGLIALTGLFCRLLVERLGWFGFITGAFSRSTKPAEVLRYRRGTLDLAYANATCSVCGAQGKVLLKTSLRTSVDRKALGEADVLFCGCCNNAFTVMKSPAAQQELVPDLPFEELSMTQRIMMNTIVSLKVKRVLSAMKVPLGAKPRILDVTGSSIEFARGLVDAGCEVVVLRNTKIPLTEPTVAGLTVIDAPLTVATMVHYKLEDSSFDAVTFWQTLGQYPTPSSPVAIAKRLLKTGGCLYLTTPNLNSLQAELGGNSWAYLDIPSHKALFTHEGVITLLKRFTFSGFTVHWFSPEYEIFGFFQTLLNVITRSHNIYYNRMKKGRSYQKIAYPIWTSIVHACKIVLLPVACVLALWADASGKSACVEMHCYK